MKGKTMKPKPVAVRRERMVYEGVHSVLQQADVHPTEGIAILLHMAVALAEGVAETPAQMRLVQEAMVGELGRTFDRAIGSSQQPVPEPERPRWAWVERLKFEIRMRFGLRWRT